MSEQHEFPRLRRRLADLDRNIYANDELIRYARSGTDGGKPDEREQRISNYRAENDDLEAEAEEIRFVFRYFERPAAVGWPPELKIILAALAVVVFALTVMAIARM